MLFSLDVYKILLFVLKYWFCRCCTYFGGLVFVDIIGDYVFVAFYLILFEAT